MELSLHDTNLKVAEEAIAEGNIKLQEALPEKNLWREKIQKTEAIIDMGIERMNVIFKAIKNIRKKKRKIDRVNDFFDFMMVFPKLQRFLRYLSNF